MLDNFYFYVISLVLARQFPCCRPQYPLGLKQNPNRLFGMNQFFKRTIIIGVSAGWLVCASLAFSAEIYIPALSAKSGAAVDIPIKIDRTDNLAGIKLVVKYDHNILTFKKASRAESTNSLMHIVNDKKPGILIVVMAGAKGIKGKDFSILSLNFEIKKDLKDNHTTQLDITECQLMSDTLKKIDCSSKLKPLVVSPE